MLSAGWAPGRRGRDRPASPVCQCGLFHVRSWIADQVTELTDTDDQSYHHSVQQWSFGKISALREAALAIEGGYPYYYMGKTIVGPY